VTPLPLQFAFKDDLLAVVRLQVKACTAPYIYLDGSGYSAKFALPMKQFRRLDDRPPLYYALAVLQDDRWIDFLVVSRARLQSYYNGKTNFGSFNKTNDDLEITVEFRVKVECSGQELTDCRKAWKSLPPLQPTPDLEEATQHKTGGGRPADAVIPPQAGPGQA